jgi:hypothetical protein
MTEDQQFRTVLGFLGGMAGEVSGRVALDPELNDRLRLFAEGSYVGSQREQDAILAEIVTDSEALGHLAELLKR